MEAIPQSLLQTAALVHYGETDMIVIFSILTSVFVIASKSYIFAFSVDKATFFFNAMCAHSDITGLFATIIWTFGLCSGEASALGSNPHFLFSTFADGAKATVVLVSIAWFSYYISTSCDTVLSLYLGSRGRWTFMSGITDVWFDPWFIGFIFCIVTIVPLATLVIGCQFCLFAYFALNTARPNHYVNPDMYYSMFEFVMRGGKQGLREWRLAELSNLITQSMEGSTSTFRRLCSSARFNQQSRIELRKSLRDLPKVAIVNNDRGQEAVRYVPPAPAPSKASSVIVWFVVYGCDPKLRPDWKESDRSRVMTAATTNTNNKYSRLNELRQDNTKEMIFRLIGSAALVVSGIVCIPLALNSIVMLLLAVIIPLFGPYQWYFSNDSPSLFDSKDVILGLIFSTLHIVSQLAAISCIPHVRRFHDIVKRTPTPDQVHYCSNEESFQFAMGEVVKEARRRYSQRLLRRDIVKRLDHLTCTDATDVISTFLD